VKKQWDHALLLFCARTTGRELCDFELPGIPSEERKKKTDFGRLVTFWFGTFAMSFALLGVLLVMRTLKDELYVVIKAYKLTS